MKGVVAIHPILEFSLVLGGIRNFIHHWLVDFGLWARRELANLFIQGYTFPYNGSKVIDFSIIFFFNQKGMLPLLFHFNSYNFFLVLSESTIQV